MSKARCSSTGAACALAVVDLATRQLVVGTVGSCHCFVGRAVGSFSMATAEPEIVADGRQHRWEGMVEGLEGLCHCRFMDLVSGLSCCRCTGGRGGLRVEGLPRCRCTCGKGGLRVEGLPRCRFTGGRGGLRVEGLSCCRCTGGRY